MTLLLFYCSGVTLVSCILLCCCNSCVCCKSNLSHRPVSAPTYFIRNVSVNPSRRSSDEQDSRIDIPIIHIDRVKSASPSEADETGERETPRNETEYTIESDLDGSFRENDDMAQDDSTDETCDSDSGGSSKNEESVDKITVEKIEGESGIGENSDMKLEASEDNGIMNEYSNYEHRGSASSTESFGEKDSESDEAKHSKEMQSMKMLGNLSHFIAKIKENSEQIEEANED